MLKVNDFMIYTFDFEIIKIILVPAIEAPIRHGLRRTSFISRICIELNLKYNNI